MDFVAMRVSKQSEAGETNSLWPPRYTNWTVKPSKLDNQTNTLKTALIFFR